MIRITLEGALKYLPSKLVPALVGIISLPIFSRYLEPQEYGHYFLALTTVNLIAALCFSWLISVVLRFYVILGIKELTEICRPLLLASLGLGSLAWLISSDLIGMDSTSWDFKFCVLVWLLGFGVFEFFLSLVRAQDHAMVYGIAMSWRSIAGLLLTLVFFAFGSQNAKVLFISGAIATCIGILLLYRFLIDSRKKEPVFENSNLVTTKEILKFGLPSGISNLLIIGLSQADRFIIGAILGTEAIALYGVNYDIAEKTVFFGNSLLLLSSSAMGFKIFEKNGEEAANLFLSNLMRLYILFALPVVVALSILSPWFLGILLPEKYAEHSNIFSIIAYSGLLVGVLHRYSLLLSFHRRADLVMWSSAGALIINLVACLFLTRQFGLAGAAIGTSLGYASWLLFIRFAATKYSNPRFPWKTLFRTSFSAALAGGIMKAVILNLNGNAYFILFIGLCVFLVLFLSFIFLTKEVMLQDFKKLR